MRSLIILLIILSQSITAYPQSRSKAEVLNREGYSLYSDGKYYYSILKFQEAIEADPSYVYPHYNIACSTSLMMANNDYSDYLEKNNLYHLSPVNKIELLYKAFAELSVAVKLDTKYKQKARSDSDLEFFKRFYEYYSILEYDLKDIYDAKQILCSIYWIMPNIYDDESAVCVLSFYPEGNIAISNINWETENDLAKESYGTFNIAIKKEGVLISIQLEQPKNGSIKFNGILRLYHDSENEWAYKPYELYIDKLTNDKDYIGKSFWPSRLSP